MVKYSTYRTFVALNIAAWIAIWLFIGCRCAEVVLAESPALIPTYAVPTPKYEPMVEMSEEDSKVITIREDSVFLADNGIVCWRRVGERTRCMIPESRVKITPPPQPTAIVTITAGPPFR